MKPGNGIEIISIQFIVVFAALFMASSSTADSHTPDGKCTGGHSMSVVWWTQEPYFKARVSKTNTVPEGLMSEILVLILQHCCHKSTTLKYQTGFEGPPSLLQVIGKEVIGKENQFDIVAPVPALPESITVKDYSFIGIVESPSVAVVRRANVNGIQLVLSVLKAWPLLVFILISAALSGILMWSLERKENTKQFPLSFAQGSFEGFWWAFVTMTTVGYGDRAPTTIPGKLLGIIWMLIGLIITTMFIGVITSALSAASLDASSALAGVEVSALNRSEEYKRGVQENAIVKACSTSKEVSKELIDLNVDGALVDIHSLKHHTKVLSKHNIQVVGSLGKPVSYGVLLARNSSKLEACFRQYVETEEDKILEILAQHTGNIQVTTLTPAEDYFGSGGVFAFTVYGGLLLFVVLFTSGMIWEKRKKKEDADGSEQGIANEGVSHGEQMQEVQDNQYTNAVQPTPRLNFGDGRSEKLLSRQSMEMIEMEEQLDTFNRNWDQRYFAMRPRATGHETRYVTNCGNIDSSARPGEMRMPNGLTRSASVR